MAITSVQPKPEDTLEQLITPSLLHSFKTQTSDEHKKTEALLDPNLRQKLDRLARRLVNNREDAEDITQRTLIRAFQSLDVFNVEQSIFSWCSKILVRQHLDRQREKHRRIKAISADSMMSDTSIEPIGNFPDPTTLEDQEASVIHFLASQSKELIEELLSNKPEYQEILLLRAEGKSYEEIQAISAYPTNTTRLRSRSFNAMHAIHKAMQEQDLTYEDLLNRFYIGR
jgi:RNA polymerase sigma-70 factor (ECF subfamily)